MYLFDRNGFNFRKKIYASNVHLTNSRLLMIDSSNFDQKLTAYLLFADASFAVPVTEKMWES